MNSKVDALKIFTIFTYFINIHWIFNAKPILVEQQQHYYLTRSWEDKGLIPFPRVSVRK